MDTSPHPTLAHRFRPRHFTSAGLLLLALATAGDSAWAQAIPGVGLSLHAPADPFTPTQGIEPFEVRITGLSGTWVMVLTRLSVRPAATSSATASELDLFYSNWPWSRPAARAGFSNVPWLFGQIHQLIAPVFSLSSLLVALSPGDGERSQAQALLLPSSPAPSGWPTTSQSWSAYPPAWQAFPDSSPGSEQTKWRSCLWAMSSGETPSTTNSTIFDPLVLAVTELRKNLGSYAEVDAFFDAAAPAMIALQLEISIEFQAVALATLPHYRAAISDLETGPLTPEDPALTGFYASLSSISTVSFSLGSPRTGVRHPQFILNGVNLAPRANSTAVFLPLRGAAGPNVQLQLTHQGTLHTLLGDTYSHRFTRFPLPPGLVAVGQSITITNVSNDLGLLPAFLPNSLDPILWGPLPVHVQAAPPLGPW